MQLDAAIFKAYDIRGIVPAAIDETLAEALGRAFGTVALAEGEACAAAAFNSPAATTRATTTASRWCWLAAPFLARRSRRCAT